MRCAADVNDGPRPARYFGLIGGLIGESLYNLCAGMVGGIEIETTSANSMGNENTRETGKAIETGQTLVLCLY